MENNPLNYVSFPRKVSVKQEIVDTDTCEILLHLESSILFLNLKFFGLILKQYISLLRAKTNLQITIRSYCNVKDEPTILK